MIVDSMSYEEIAHEIRKDMKGVMLELRKFATSKKYRKERLGSPNRGEMHFRTFTLTSSLNNKYVVYPYSPSRKHYLEYGYICMTPVFMGLHHGQFYAVTRIKTYTDRIADIHFYTGHFFQRYNERFLHDPSLTIGEVVNHFFNYDIGDMAYNKVVNPKTNKEEEICNLKNGVSFVEMGGDFDYFIHRTFVNSELLYAKQNKDALVMEAIECMCRKSKTNNNKQYYALSYRIWQSILQPYFMDYSFYHSLVKENHEGYQGLQNVSKRLYDILKDVWGITQNVAMQRFGNHLQAIIHASGYNEIEAIVKAEKNKQMA